jgi:hypothetical protein
MAEIGEPDHVVRRERETPVINPPAPIRPVEVPEFEPA